ncbi:MAG: hypothetical protein WC027_00650 [Candidatus Paceibacterota bacterium]
MKKEKIKEAVKKINTPFFIYDEAILNRNINRIIEASKNANIGGRIRLFASYFTNSNPNLFKSIQNESVGILLQTPEEWHQLKPFGLNREMITSPSFLSNEEIDFWTNKNITINLASFEEIRYFVQKYKKAPLSFRIDATFWQKQRTGLKIKQLKEISEFLKNQSVTPYSFHIYCGTGSSLKKIKKYLIRSLKIYRKYFPNVKEINLGGGFAYDYKSLLVEEKHFDWSSYFAYLKQKIKEFNISPEVRFILEPGRDIFADIGVQVLKVKRVVNYPNLKSVSTDGSYVFMPSAAKRNRKHNLDFYDQNFNLIPKEECFSTKLSGSTTLSSDYIMPNVVQIPEPIKESDYIVVKDLGAYGATQHMEFLNKKPCPEILIDNEGKLKLITTEGVEADKTRYALLTPKLL